MFGKRELAQLDLRKAELLAAGDAIRGEMRQDWVRMQPAMLLVQSGASLMCRLQPIYPAVAALLGIWVVRRKRSRTGLIAKLVLGWRLWRSAAAMWTAFNRPKSEPPESPRRPQIIV